MTTSTIKRTLLALTIIAIPLSCIREAESQPQEEAQEKLHEVVFHAGWEPETKTALQEDGSVWWSPGDEISLFVNDGQDGEYKLTATNTEPAAKVDFVGQIGGDLQGATFTAIYPYNEANRMDGNSVIFTIPTEQTAKEGTFGNGMLVSYAVSDNESLMFHNLCGGIKFSVAHEGIKKLVITSTGPNALAGEMTVWPDGPVCAVSGSNTITILAPDNVFEKEKYYYAVIAASEQNSWNGGEIQITYYTEDSAATTILPPVLFKRSVFKRLYEADKDLKFKRVYDSMALLPYEFLPEGVDKTTISEAYFHVSDPTTTETIISAGDSKYDPIYFEMIGTVAHFYTTGQVYKCYTMQQTFNGWKSLLSLDLSMFDVADVQYMPETFRDCHSLQSLDLSSFDTSEVSTFEYMFYNCFNLKTLDLTNFDTSKAVNMSHMFSNCKSLTSLDISGFDTSSVTNFSGMVGGLTSIEQLDLSNIDTSNATDISGMFGDLTLSSIDISTINTSNVVDASALFSGCWNLRSIDVSHFDTHNMENMGAMFAGCRSLKSIDISKFDLSSVSCLSFLFKDCASLKDITMPSSSAPNLQMIHSMFEGCSSLQNIDLSSFDTSNVTMMIDMFMNCHSLKSLDLSSFNVENVPSYRRMFYGCDNLEHLNISSFNPTTIADAEYTFYDTRKLTTLDLGEFDLSQSNNNGVGHYLGELAKNCHIRCTPATKDALIAASSLLSDSKYIWYTDGSPLPDVDYENEEGLYCSKDYSKDKTVRTVQLASEGAGIDLVVMGDAYSDRLIDDGTYDTDMEKAIDAIFAVEPFKSFKHLFNIYIVYAVSENEVIGKSTALSCFNEWSPIGSSGWIWKAYYACAAKVSSPGECSPVVVMNSAISDGAATGFLTWTTGDYMNDPLRDDYHGGVSEAVAYISGPNDERFDYTVRHEFGHSFGFLMDEYNNYSYAITDWDTQSWQICFAYGMYKNVDLVSDSTVKWAKFINDPRYAGTGIGVYEGALFETGAWRSSPESIMNSTDSGFNAPSREAIYYKIHKLAYGRDWNYSYEDFVTYDSDNIAADKARMSASKAGMKRATPSFKREPIFKRSIVTGPDGKERIKIEMN